MDDAKHQTTLKEAVLRGARARYVTEPLPRTPEPPITDEMADRYTRDDEECLRCPVCGSLAECRKPDNHGLCPIDTNQPR